MTMEQVAALMQDLGGYGVAAVFLWLWRTEREERQRYRDLYETVLQSIPEQTAALKELTNEVARIHQRHFRPGA